TCPTPARGSADSRASSGPAAGCCSCARRTPLPGRGAAASGTAGRTTAANSDKHAASIASVGTASCGFPGCTGGCGLAESSAHSAAISLARDIRPGVCGPEHIMPSRIEDYALVGDCETAALIGRDGSVDWLCLPRFDARACFAALLGTRENGRWQIAPADE